MINIRSTIRAAMRDFAIAISPIGAPVLFLAASAAGSCRFKSDEIIECSIWGSLGDWLGIGSYLELIGSLLLVGAFLFGASLIWIFFAGRAWLRLARTLLGAILSRPAS